jgi:hypothetical protein
MSSRWLTGRRVRPGGRAGTRRSSSDVGTTWWPDLRTYRLKIDQSKGKNKELIILARKMEE